MRLLAIDPGPTESAWLLYDVDTAMVVKWAKESNNDVRQMLSQRDNADALVVEMIASYGMAVGKDVFETCVWIGRFMERYGDDATRIFRRDVKVHLCGSVKAKDANIRQALIDRFGPGKDAAIGRKAQPGPLYGLAGDGWAALGVAVTCAETVLRVPTLMDVVR